MFETSVLTKELKSFDYYVHKLPMFLQQSCGFIEHFRIWYDLLVGVSDGGYTGVVGAADTLFALLNIFDLTANDEGDIVDGNIEDYLNVIAMLPDSKVDVEGHSTACDTLDKIASLFGLTRSFEVTYLEDDVEHKEVLSLNNAEFLILIKAQIIKNYCNGTYEQIKAYYESVGLYIFVTTASDSATSELYLVKTSQQSEYTQSENVRKMFLSGLLTIQNMGIAYRTAIIDLNNILLWKEQTGTIEYGWGDGNIVGGQWLV